MEGAISPSSYYPAMKGIILLSVFLVLISAGCIQKEASSDKSVSTGPLSVKITSLKPGEIFSDGKDVLFDSEVKGGKEPYTYKWTSNINGVMSTGKSFTRKFSEIGKGEHTIILKITDATGSTAEGSVDIYVM